MVCENESDIDIRIPTVMLPQDAGTNLENDLKNNSTGIFSLFCLYLPTFAYEWLGLSVALYNIELETVYFLSDTQHSIWEGKFYFDFFLCRKL